MKLYIKGSDYSRKYTIQGLGFSSKNKLEKLENLKIGEIIIFNNIKITRIQ